MTISAIPKFKCGDIIINEKKYLSLVLKVYKPYSCILYVIYPLNMQSIGMGIFWPGEEYHPDHERIDKEYISIKDYVAK